MYECEYDSEYGLSDRKLLAKPIRELPGLRDGALARRLEPYVGALYRELGAAGLRRFRPEVYLGDEWFSPSGLAMIAVPFYLAHPRLAQLEKRMTGAVEGGTPATLRQLLRHEAGHAFDHAYGVSRTRAWRQVFGAKPERYNPDVYRPDPTSRDFVRHLPGGYAQAHPDEDFAETFAVVITPGSAWRRRYRAWPKAYAKLGYVADLIEAHADVAPRPEAGGPCYVAARMRSTLGDYYARRLAAERANAAAVKRLADLSRPVLTH
jgi:hypothetical protein